MVSILHLSKAQHLIIHKLTIYGIMPQLNNVNGSTQAYSINHTLHILLNHIFNLLYHPLMN
jgi:hypothetical protein